MTPDAIVVGGGIVGLSAAAGMLAPQVHADGDTPLLGLSLRARDRHLALAGELEAETGISVELSTLGALDLSGRPPLRRPYEPWLGDRSHNYKTVLSGHIANIPNISFVNSSHDRDGSWLLSTGQPRSSAVMK